ncbi:MAG: hypothetical protein RR922_00210 [Clostridia bacterium]
MHSNDVYNTINRLSMLAKRSDRAQAYSLEFLKQIFASSLDILIHLDNFKIKQIVKIEYQYKDDTYKYLDLNEENK